MSEKNIGKIKVIEVTVNGFSNKIRVCAVYRSQKIKVKNFLSDLKSYLVQFSEKNCEQLIFGDININILNRLNDVDDYLNTIAINGFRPVINEVTRPNSDNGTCIDHAFLRLQSPIESYERVIVHEKITDHFPILVTIPVEKQRQMEEKRTPAKRLNRGKIFRLAVFENWTDVYSAADADYAAEIFVRKLQNMIAESTYEVRTTRKAKKTWINWKMVNEIKKRDLLSKKMKNSTDNSVLIEFKKQRNLVNSLKKKMINNYNKKQLKFCEKDSKKCGD